MARPFFSSSLNDGLSFLPSGPVARVGPPENAVLGARNATWTTGRWAAGIRRTKWHLTGHREEEKEKKIRKWTAKKLPNPRNCQECAPKDGKIRNSQRRKHTCRPAKATKHRQPVKIVKFG